MVSFGFRKFKFFFKWNRGETFSLHILEIEEKFATVLFRNKIVLSLSLFSLYEIERDKDRYGANNSLAF